MRHRKDVGAIHLGILKNELEKKGGGSERKHLMKIKQTLSFLLCKLKEIITSTLQGRRFIS